MIFKWPITKFSKTASRSDPRSTVKSGIFAFDDSNLKFYLRLDPTNLHEDKPNDHCAIYLMLKELDEEPSPEMKFTFWVENTRGEKIKPHKGLAYKFEVVEHGYGYSTFLHHDRLYSPQFVKDDVVIVCCELRRASPDLTESDLKERIVKTAGKEWDFHEQGFSELCTIQVNDQHFKVGKDKLMAASPVFEKMFQHSDMEEAKTDTLKIVDSSPAVIQSLVKFLYIQPIDCSEKIALEVYTLADKYDIALLKKECTRMLVAGLNDENVFDRLILAFGCNDGVFKKEIFDYFAMRSSDETFKKVLKSDQWKKFAFENGKSSNEIIDEVFKTLNWH
jgi:hypothetical protein